MRVPALSGLLAAVALASCLDTEPLSVSDVPNPATAARDAVPRLDQAQPLTLDDHLEQLARRAPGFGGMFIDSFGALNVWVKGPANVSGVRAAITDELQRAQLGEKAANLLGSLRVLPATYDYVELREWYDRLSSVSALDEVTQTDIDERANRLAIGVTPGADRAELLASLQAQGVPPEALVLNDFAPTNVVVTLQDQVRPVVGALRISSSQGLCTLSFNAKRAVYSGGSWVIDPATKYFLTAAHCTSTFGAQDGTVVGQPDASHPIGTEIVDPPLVTSAQVARCPVGRYCRYSDAALFEYNPTTSMTFGAIAKTSSGLNISGSYTLSATGCGWLCSIPGWTVLRKIGATSGTSSGTVQSACVDVKQYAAGVDTGRTMLCQEQVAMTSQGGDSGSPVLDSGSGSTLQGILWGTSWLQPGDPIYATYAYIYHVRSEIVNASGVWIAPCTSCIF